MNKRAKRWGARAVVVDCESAARAVSRRPPDCLSPRQFGLATELFVNDRQYEVGDRFDQLCHRISRPRPATTSTALQDHKILGFFRQLPEIQFRCTRLLSMTNRSRAISTETARLMRPPGVRAKATGASNSVATVKRCSQPVDRQVAIPPPPNSPETP